MLSVVMPVKDIPEMTDECIDNLLKHRTGNVEIIVIDNGSVYPYQNKAAKVIHNEENIGFWPSMQQGINAANNNIVMCMHNDVLIWEPNYDKRILEHFRRDDLLAVAGLFGGRGVGIDGGRGHPEGNMLAKKYGTPQSLHGHLLTGSHPAVVFDSLCMIFDATLLNTIDVDSIPIHHWTDRIVTLELVTKGYHALTIGIGFDHGGGFTSSVVGTKNNAMENWCNKHSIPFNQSWDLTVYDYGRQKFEKRFREVVKTGNQLWVTNNWEYHAI